MHTANALKFLQLVCENSYKKASAKQSVLGSDPWEMHSEVGLIGGTLICPCEELEGRELRHGRS